MTTNLGILHGAMGESLGGTESKTKMRSSTCDVGLFAFYTMSHQKISLYWSHHEVKLLAINK
jgi:hypothetical protein